MKKQPKKPEKPKKTIAQRRTEIDAKMVTGFAPNHRAPREKKVAKPTLSMALDHLTKLGNRLGQAPRWATRYDSDHNTVLVVEGIGVETVYDGKTGEYLRMGTHQE